MGYARYYREAEQAVLAALRAVKGALDSVKGVRREHVQILDDVRATLEEALEELRRARPKGVV